MGMLFVRWLISDGFVRQSKRALRMAFYRTTLDYLRVPSGCPITSYYWSGFSTLQASIDHTWLGWKDSRHATPSVGLQLLPMIEFTSCK